MRGQDAEEGGGRAERGRKLNWLNLCQALKDDNGDISLYRDSFCCIWRWMQPGDLSSLHAQLFVATSKDLAVVYSGLWAKRELRKTTENHASLATQSALLDKSEAADPTAF